MNGAGEGRGDVAEGRGPAGVLAAGQGSGASQRRDEAEDVGADEIRRRIDDLKKQGLLEVHPDDKEKPWAEQRLRRTPLGDLLSTGGKGTAMARSEFVREGTGYLPGYLKDTKYPGSSGTSTLLVRRFRITRGPSGKEHLHIKTDALEFPDDDTMVAAIEEQEMFELPEEADGNPQFVPEGWRV